MADYQFNFNGTTFGGVGSPIQILNVTGLEEAPAYRSGDIDRGYQHGEFPGMDLAAGRTVTIDMLVLDSGTGDYFTNIELVKALTVPMQSEQVMTFTLPSRTSRILRCRPRRRSLPVDREYQFRKGNVSVEFHATDPLIYDATLTSVTLSLPAATTGLAFPATAPFAFGTASSSGATTVTNSGNMPAPWVAQINGPLVNPTITQASTGYSVQFVGTLAAGDVLTVDSLARSVLLNGTASRYAWLTTTSTWFTLPVGSSTVQFGGVSGAGTLQFSYRSAWL